MQLGALIHLQYVGTFQLKLLSSIKGLSTESQRDRRKYEKEVPQAAPISSKL